MTRRFEEKLLIIEFLFRTPLRSSRWLDEHLSPLGVFAPERSNLGAIRNNVFEIGKTEFNLFHVREKTDGVMYPNIFSVHVVARFLICSGSIDLPI